MAYSWLHTCVEQLLTVWIVNWNTLRRVYKWTDTFCHNKMTLHTAVHQINSITSLLIELLTFVALFCTVYARIRHMNLSVRSIHLHPGNVAVFPGRLEYMVEVVDLTGCYSGTGSRATTRLTSPFNSIRILATKTLSICCRTFDSPDWPRNEHSGF